MAFKPANFGSVEHGNQHAADAIIASLDGMDWRSIAKVLAGKLAEAELVARRHCSPASNVGAHALAAKIVQIIERPVT